MFRNTFLLSTGQLQMKKETVCHQSAPVSKQKNAVRNSPCSQWQWNTLPLHAHTLPMYQLPPPIPYSLLLLKKEIKECKTSIQIKLFLHVIIAKSKKSDYFVWKNFHHFKNFEKYILIILFRRYIRILMKVWEKLIF